MPVLLLSALFALSAAQTGAQELPRVRVIATGGLSPLFARGTDVIEAADGDLTMRGLVLIHRYNKTGKYDE